MEYEILNLNLASPLFYILDTESAPFDYREDGEKLFCFQLEEAEYLRFEPDKEKLIGRLLFSGKVAENNTEGAIELPSGNYIFAQEKRHLNREEIADMAAEIQSEALWQRLKPGDKLFLRYLYEDGNWVTQLFRPYL